MNKKKCLFSIKHEDIKRIFRKKTGHQQISWQALPFSISHPKCNFHPHSTNEKLAKHSHIQAQTLTQAATLFTAM